MDSYSNPSERQRSQPANDLLENVFKPRLNCLPSFCYPILRISPQCNTKSFRHILHMSNIPYPTNHPTEFRTLKLEVDAQLCSQPVYGPVVLGIQLITAASSALKSQVNEDRWDDRPVINFMVFTWGIQIGCKQVFPGWFWCVTWCKAQTCDTQDERPLKRTGNTCCTTIVVVATTLGYFCIFYTTGRTWFVDTIINHRPYIGTNGTFVQVSM